MKCPQCKKKSKTFSTHTFYDENGNTRTMRRYVCESCHIRFTTNEVLNIKSIKRTDESYDTCFNTAEYDGQDCKKCPYLKECGGCQ